VKIATVATTLTSLPSFTMSWDDERDDVSVCQPAQRIDARGVRITGRDVLFTGQFDFLVETPSKLE
jgi:hypothetical protein